MELSKNCPCCGKEQKYSRIDLLKNAIKKNSLCNSCKQIGDRNHFFNKNHSDETKKHISKWNKNRGGIINNKISKKLKNKPKSEDHRKKISDTLMGKYVGEMNPNYGKKLSEEQKEVIRQCTLRQHYQFKQTEEYEKYYTSLSELKKYKKLVWKYTNENNLTLLENHEKRGSQKNNDDAYHLDHIFSITMGFINEIPPELIGDIKNLKFIHWKENLIKGNRIKEIPKHIKNEYEKKRKKSD